MVKTQRCAWSLSDDLYIDYHDTEWGVPVVEPQPLFERLTLEGMQAGLSWLTILKKRAHMQSAFHGFDPVTLAACGEREVAQWLDDAGVIRHRGKLKAMISNAQAFLSLDDPVAFLWSFADASPQQSSPRQNRWESLDQVPSQTDASKAMSKALKAAGFRFVGPTICYAFMQSAGLVNDHVTNCFRHEPCEALQAQCAARFSRD